MAERDAKGRFVKGHSGGPGRKPRQVEADYLNATFAAVSIDDWDAIVRRAVRDAKQGNAWARNWLGDYLIGKPPQILELRAVDAALLRDLLKEFEARGVSPAEAFETMIATFAELEGEDVDDGR